MVQQLNWVISNCLLWLIKIYQRFLSGKIKNRRCIYSISCSNYAISELENGDNIFKSIVVIYKRYKNCKILNIVCKKSDICKESNKWHIINGSGKIIHPHQLSSFTVKNIREIIYEKIM